MTGISHDVELHAQGPLRYRRRTPYHDLRVEDWDGCRYLFSGEGRASKHSCICLKDLRRHMLDYSRLVFSAACFVLSPRRALVLGLGGGVIPREMFTIWPDVEVEVMEIDPHIVEVARRFFFLPESPRLRVWIGDGRVRMEDWAAQGRRFDWIVLDAFDGEYVPAHLRTIEFMRTVCRLRADPGIVIANLFNSHPLYPAQVATFAAAFGEPLYELRGPRAVSTSIIFAPSATASRDEDAMAKEAATLSTRLGLSFRMEIPRRLAVAAFREQATPLRDTPRFVHSYMPGALPMGMASEGPWKGPNTYTGPRGGIP